MSFLRTRRIRPSPTQVDPSKKVTGPASSVSDVVFLK